MSLDSYATPAREYAKGIGDAVADRTINRKLASIEGTTRIETWADVAYRVALGNSSLLMDNDELRSTAMDEFHTMHHHLRNASLLMSGRHLQHGDADQPGRNLEVFTNCATAAATFLSFYLLLNGAGVGRSYDDDMIVVDWRQMPIVVPVIDSHHKDVQSGEIVAQNYQSVKHLYASRRQRYFRVPDSREGWAKAIEVMELLAFQEERNTVLILDFSDVRPRGAPIFGMQGRPASGPGALMKAIENIAALRDAGMQPWRSAMYADHYMAECVLVGGARRAARMSTKYWKDDSIFEFIEVKRGGFLWSSNNSVAVDKEFWRHVHNAAAGVHSHDPYEDEQQEKAWEVFKAITEAAYYDKTGEPGLINVDQLAWDSAGVDCLFDGDFAGSKKYQLNDSTKALLMKRLANAFKHSKTAVITNPCGEIVLNKLGGYCVIADVVPYFAGPDWNEAEKLKHPDEFNHLWDADAESAFCTAARALIRTNTMNSLYDKEVKRTNRIGVGITGLHEYAWARFGYGWKDIVNEAKSLDFWLTLARFKRAITKECENYSRLLGVTVPHTNTTLKPAGCASLDTAIKTGDGIVSMRDLFALHGITEDSLLKMEDGTWITPTVKTVVFDEGNVEREVTKLYLNGVKPVFEIEFEDGTIVKLTGNHKLKTVAGEWKRVDELTESDEVLQQRN